MNECLKNLSRLEFVVTMACTGRCKHCSQGDHGGYSGCIDTGAAAKVIRDVCGEYEIGSLMAFGGEPLLYPDTVCEIFRTGRAKGIPKIDLITNGFFSRNADRIFAVTRMLAESGVNRILLSVDAFHQETIPLGPVKYFARRALAERIDLFLHPAWLVSAEDGNSWNERTRAVLREFEELGLPVGEGNVIFPGGNALRYLGDYFDGSSPLSSPYEQDPRDIRAVSIDPNGDVLNGNIYRQNILDILNGYRP